MAVNVTKRLLKFVDIFKVLIKFSAKLRKAIISHSDKEFCKVISECIYNIGRGVLRLRKKQKSALRKHKTACRKLLRRGLSTARKKKILLQKT